MKTEFVASEEDSSKSNKVITYKKGDDQIIQVTFTHDGKTIVTADGLVEGLEDFAAFVIRKALNHSDGEVIVDLGYNDDAVNEDVSKFGLKRVSDKRYVLADVPIISCSTLDGIRNDLYSSDINRKKDAQDKLTDLMRKVIQSGTGAVRFAGNTNKD